MTPAEQLVNKMAEKAMICLEDIMVPKHIHAEGVKVIKSHWYQLLGQFVQAQDRQRRRLMKEAKKKAKRKKHERKNSM